MILTFEGNKSEEIFLKNKEDIELSGDGNKKKNNEMASQQITMCRNLLLSSE
jgi:hypothetical protein